MECNQLLLLFLIIGAYQMLAFWAIGFADMGTTQIHDERMLTRRLTEMLLKENVLPGKLPVKMNFEELNFEPPSEKRKEEEMKLEEEDEEAEEVKEHGKGGGGEEEEEVNGGAADQKAEVQIDPVLPELPIEPVELERNEKGGPIVPVQLEGPQIETTLVKMAEKCLMDIQAATCITFKEVQIQGNGGQTWAIRFAKAQQVESCELNHNVSWQLRIFLSDVCIRHSSNWLLKGVSILLGLKPEVKNRGTLWIYEKLRGLHCKSGNRSGNGEEGMDTKYEQILQTKKALLAKKDVLEKAIKMSQNRRLNAKVETEKERIGKRQLEMLERKLRKLQQLENETRPLPFSIYPTWEEMRRQGVKRDQMYEHNPIRLWNIYKNRETRKYQVPYYFKNMSEEAVYNVRHVMREIQGKTCLEFVPFDAMGLAIEAHHYTGQEEGTHMEFTKNAQYIEFVDNTNFCQSLIGRQEYALGQFKSFMGAKVYYQEIRLSSWCSTYFVGVTHEIFHALGLFHFHSAANRDEFLQVIDENVSEDGKFDFKKIKYFRVLPEHMRQSIMIYPSDNQFQVNEDMCNIMTKDGKPIEVPEFVPDSDWDVVNRLYGCRRNPLNGHWEYGENSQQAERATFDKKHRRNWLNSDNGNVDWTLGKKIKGGLTKSQLEEAKAKKEELNREKVKKSEQMAKANELMGKLKKGPKNRLKAEDVKIATDQNGARNMSLI